MEPEEVESLIRQLVAIAAHQMAINERHDLSIERHDLRIERQDTIIERLDLAIERIEATLAAIKDLLERGQNGR